MAKEKLFTPEDFDKPKPKNNKLLKTILIALGVLVLIALCVWGISSLSKDKADEQETEVVTDPTGQEQQTVTETIEQSDTSEAVSEGLTESTTEQIAEVEETPEQTPPAVTSTPVKESTPSVSQNVEAEALKVVRGDYGNVPERKQLLGEQYQVIQDRVNQMKRQGLF